MELPLKCPQCGFILVYRKQKLRCRNCGYRVRAKPFTFKIPVAELGILKKEG